MVSEVILEELKMRTCFLLASLAIGIIGDCQEKGTSDDAQMGKQLSSTDKPLEEVQLHTRIRQALESVRKDSVIDYASLDSLLHYFELNEKLTRKTGGFPQQDGDLSLLQNTTDYLIEKASRDYICMKFLIRLSLTVSRIVEYSEHLTESIPQMAIKNTEGFVKAYRDLEKQRGYLIESIEYIGGPKELNHLLSNLDQLKDSGLRGTVIDLRTELKGKYQK
jgi:hypothetical protein